MISRIRAFVIDEETGKTLNGVPIVVAGDIAAEDGDARPATQRIVFSVFQSDHNGYISAPVELHPATQAVFVYPLADETRELDITDYPSGSIMPGLLALKVPSKFAGTSPQKAGFPSVVAPEIEDCRISPNSLGSQKPIPLGEAGCEDLLLSRAAVQTFHFSQLVREPDNEPSGLEPSSDLAHCEDDLDEPPLCWRRGALLEYEMTWTPQGHALGEIVYSLPLAPCESVNLAVLEWSRKDELFRGEDTSITEQLQHNLRRDRLVEEAVRGAIHESQSGGSLQGGAGLSLGSVNLSLGGGYSASGGQRNVASDAIQRLADGITQSSTALRRFHSTVVVQASQAERDVVATRTVTNHNHCHALTMLYYEVMRHYCVDTKLARKRDIVLVKRPLLSFATLDQIRRLRPFLEPTLLDRSLRKCFDAVDKEYCERVRLAERAYVEKAEDHELQMIKALITTGNNGAMTDGSPNNSYEFYLEIKLKVKSGQSTALDRNLHTDTLHRNQSNIGYPTKTSEIAGWRQPANLETGVLGSGQQDIFNLHPNRRTTWGQVVAIEVRLGGHFQNPDWMQYDLAHLRLTTSYKDNHWVLFDGNVNHLFNGVDQPSLNITLDVLPFGPQKSEDLLTIEELCCIRRLMDHLQHNALYYSRAVWLREDSGVRARWLDRYHFDLNGEQGRLLDFVENRLVGVVGDYVALPLVFEGFSEQIESPRQPEARMISLPTRGVFAEAKLGHCNSCEEIDATRFWDWTESPCPEKAPAIAPISPGSRAQSVAVTPTTLPERGIGITAPPDAPAVTGIASVLDALSKSDLFRDMSGRAELSDVMEALVEGAVDLEREKIRSQSQTPVASPNRPSPKPPSAPASKPSTQTTPARTMHDVLKVVEAAVARGQMTPEQARQIIDEVDEIALGTEKPSTSPSYEYHVPDGEQVAVAGEPAITQVIVWAIATTMMFSWRDKGSSNAQPYTIQEAMALLDQRHGSPMFLDRWAASEGILVSPATSSNPAVDELSDLLAATQTTPGAKRLIRDNQTVFNAAKGILPTPSQVRDLIMQNGPLWFTYNSKPGVLDEDANDIAYHFATDGIIVTGVSGDGTSDNSHVTMRDTYYNKSRTESFQTFQNRIENYSMLPAQDGDVFLIYYQ